MAAQKRVVMGKQVRIDDRGLWTLWSEGQRAGRYWAFQRREGEPSLWLEVRAVAAADGVLTWVEAR